jgi:hypothetical protein
MAHKVKIDFDLNKAIKDSLISLTKNINNRVVKEITTKYKYTEKDFKGLWINEKNPVSFANGVFTGRVVYQHKFVPLGYFSSDMFEGNINFPNKRTGIVQRVSITRSKRTMVKGLEHRGGFTPIKGSFKNPKPSQTRSFQGKRIYNLLERKSASRDARQRLLFAPSPAQLAGKAFRINANVRSFINSEIAKLGASIAKVYQ